MRFAEALLQSAVVVLWGAYALVGMWSRGRRATQRMSSAEGAAIADALLGSVPVEALLLPTVVMVVALVGLDVVFAIIDRV